MVFKRVVLRHAGHSVGKTFLVILFLILRDFSMAAPTPPVPSTLYSSAVGNQQLPPTAVAAQARARAGQRRFASWGWHANSTARSMAPYSMHNPAAKAIVMMPDHPQPPQRQLVPLQQPAAGAAGNRRDFFPNGPLDLKADGTRAALVNWGYVDGMHPGRFSVTGRSMAFNSHSAPGSWGYSTSVNGQPGVPGQHVPGRYPGLSVPGPMSMREERDAQGFITVNAYDGAQLRVDVSDIGTMRLHDGVTNKPGPCREHFSSVDIARRIVENPLLAALHAQSFAKGGPGVTGHWVTVKANEGTLGVDGLTVVNSFIRKFALMTPAEKTARGMGWIVDILAQLPDDCTVPRYCAFSLNPRCLCLAPPCDCLIPLKQSHTPWVPIARPQMMRPSTRRARSTTASTKILPNRFGRRSTGPSYTGAWPPILTSLKKLK